MMERKKNNIQNRKKFTKFQILNFDEINYRDILYNLPTFNTRKSSSE